VNRQVFRKELGRGPDKAYRSELKRVPLKGAESVLLPVWSRLNVLQCVQRRAHQRYPKARPKSAAK